jgi:transcription initiation factor TFIIIB Brf1 subunit/transcription initiation factor TFIIB
MSMVTCPKCGKSQPVENIECTQCGVIFKKLLQPKIAEMEASPDKHEPPATVVTQNNFLPETGLKRNLEISILNIVAYAYLVLGVGAGVGIVLDGEDKLKYFIGFSVIIGCIITSMLFFIFCTIAEKIISIDSTLNYIAKLVAPQENKMNHNTQAPKSC